MVTLHHRENLVRVFIGNSSIFLTRHSSIADLSFFNKRNSNFFKVFFLFHLSRRDGFRSFLDLESPFVSFFPFFFYQNKFFLVFFRDFVIWVMHCVVHHFVRRCLILCLIGVLVWLILKDLLQSITDSINDLDVNIADPEACVFRWFKFYHNICRHFVVLTWVLWVYSQIHPLRF